MSEVTLDADELTSLDAHWRAANYLSVGQIYLLANPLLRERLKIEHVKPRLLGHWGTTPGLNFIYAHLDRVIRRDDLDMIYVAGPGHGGPAMIANTWLEGSYSELYPEVGQDAEGVQRLFKQFSDRLDGGGYALNSDVEAAAYWLGLPVRRWRLQSTETLQPGRGLVQQRVTFGDGGFTLVEMLGEGRSGELAQALQPEIGDEEGT